MDRDNNTRDNIPDDNNLPPNKPQIRLKWKTDVINIDVDTGNMISYTQDHYMIEKLTTYKIDKEHGIRQITKKWRSKGQGKLFGER